jgi:predicted nucleic acid-binding protein
MNDAALVDTDVISYFLKDDTRALLYLPHIDQKTIVLSFMTIAEVERWMLQRKWGVRRYRKWEEILRSCDIYQVTLPLCRKWAEVTEAARRAGRPIACADAWIAATALALGVPLITNNRNDYLGVSGLTIISETA